MNEEEDQFFVDPDVEELQLEITAEPILDYEQPTFQEPKIISLKMLEPIKKEESIQYHKFKFQHHSEEEDEDDEAEYDYESPFTEFYSPEQCCFQKVQNKNLNRMNGTMYFAGVFVHKNVFLDNTNCETPHLEEILKNYYEMPAVEPAPSKDLVFDSRFQSGNLFAAFKVSTFEYDLVMSHDTNSIGNNQWFFFSMAQMQPNKQYTLNVVNFTKSDSLFNYGLSPVIYSLLENKKSLDNDKGWKRSAKDVSYRKGLIPREQSRRFYYKLSFKVTSEWENDKLFVAYSYPYTYSKLERFVSEKTSKHKDLVSKMLIGKTLSKRNLEALVIAQPINKKRDTRKAIIIMGRQHPGETQGSFVCEGFIDRLLAKTKESEFLIKNYVFYVIPMVNPDGVVFGHYRTNLAGKDLNRKWNCSQKDSECPEVVSIKSFLQEISKERDIRFILDMHGHSKKLGSFFYGNPCVENPDVARIFPYVCSKLSPAINFNQCSFASEEYKRKAARVYLSFLFKQIHVYTFESSFYAYLKDGKKIEFNPKQYRDLGSIQVTALFMQLEHEIKFQQSFQFNLSKSNSKEFCNSPFVKLISELKNNKALLEIGTALDSGSESKPEENQINSEEVALAKQITRPISTPVVISSTKTSRKVTRESKDFNFTKPTRNIKFLEISRVNSILPDKYQLGLQPIKRQDPINQTLRRNSTSKKISCDSQTEAKSELKYIEFKAAEIESCKLSMNIRNEVLPERKFSSVIKSHNRNIIFKIDLFRQAARNQIEEMKSKVPVQKHAFSQTMITYSKENGEKLKSINLSEIPSPNREAKLFQNNSMRLEANMRLGLRREAELLFASKLLQEKEQKAELKVDRIEKPPLSIAKKEISKK